MSISFTMMPAYVYLAFVFLRARLTASAGMFTLSPIPTVERGLLMLVTVIMLVTATLPLRGVAVT